MATVESISRSGIHLSVTNPTLLVFADMIFWIGNSDWYYFAAFILAANIILAIHVAQKRKVFYGASFIEPSRYKVLLFYDQLCGRSDLSTANKFYQLGMIMKSRGRYNDAICNFKEAKYIMEILSITRETKYELFSIVECSTQIASSFGALGKYRKSRECFKMAISVIERKHGKDHIVIGTILNDMAIMLKNSGEYKQSMKCYQRALDIFESLGNDKQIAIINSNLSLLYSRMEDYETALDCTQRALDMKLKSNISGDQSIAFTHNNQGLILQKLGRLDDALKCHLLALKIKKNTTDNKNDRLSLARSYFNIACVYAEKSEHSEASRYSAMSKSIREKILGEHHYLSKESQEHRHRLQHR